MGDLMRNTVSGHRSLIRLNTASLESLTRDKPELRTADVESALGILRAAIEYLDRAADELDEYASIRPEETSIAP